MCEQRVVRNSLKLVLLTMH